MHKSNVLAFKSNKSDIMYNVSSLDKKALIIYYVDIFLTYANYQVQIVALINCGGT